MCQLFSWKNTGSGFRKEILSFINFFPGKIVPLIMPKYFNIGAVIFSAYRELKNDQELCKWVLRDLHAQGLITDWNLGGIMTWEGALSKRSTAMGRQFLDFIHDPTVEDTDAV